MIKHTAEYHADPQLEFTRRIGAAQPAFHGFPLSQAPNRHSADDLMQESACRLGLKFPEYARTKPFVAPEPGMRERIKSPEHPRTCGTSPTHRMN